MTEIVQLDQLLKYQLGPNKKIKEYFLENLTQPGENYGSTMLAVEVHIKNWHKDLDILYLVGKAYPTNPFTEVGFNSPLTFWKEIGFYSVIVEELKIFEKEQKVSGLIDFFPKYFGGRLSLDTSAKRADKDAIFLLENLKKQNYISVDRLVGYDLKTAHLIVKKLAVFHAISVALKIKKPGLFQSKILRLLEKAHLPFDDDENTEYIEYLASLIGTDENLKPHVKRVTDCFGKASIFYGTGEARSPFAAICHNDFWLNNILVRYEKDDPLQIKIVDYQVIDYGSPSRDLLFFVFHSVQREVLEENADDLLEVYFQTFVDTLDKFKIDPDHTIFTREEFEKEMQIEAKHQLVHILDFFSIVLLKRGTVKPLDELKQEDMKFNPDGLVEEYRPRVLYAISEFIKRNWI